MGPLPIIVAVVLLLLAVYVVVNYNRFVAVRAHLRESWSDIDVELKRRYELVPNLVETVKGYAAHERAVLEEVTRLRDRAAQPHGSAAMQAVDESALAIGVEKLLAVAEAYPDLKADTHFLALQRELALTEDRIAAARRFYNGNVRDLNELCQAFPTNLIAGLFGFERADYFDAGEQARLAPKVGL
ncbi:MAG: LemA family protein [Planctomycetota bacterium]